MKNWHSDFQNSRKSSTSKLKIEVPQVLASKSMVIQVQIKYRKNLSTIQGIQGIQVLLATLFYVFGQNQSDGFSLHSGNKA